MTIPLEAFSQVPRTFVESVEPGLRRATIAEKPLPEECLLDPGPSRICLNSGAHPAKGARRGCQYQEGQNAGAGLVASRDGGKCVLKVVALAAGVRVSKTGTA